MPWRPGRNGTVCRSCERNVSDCGPLSARGKCHECGPLRQTAAMIDLHTHSGHFFHQWRRGMAASVGAVLLDDLPEQD